MTLRYLTPALMAISLAVSTASDAGEAPFYKPSSRSPAAIDISLEQYGGSDLAPNALTIGDLAPDFTLPVSGGGMLQLQQVANKGPVVIIFYRGHW